MDSVAQRTTALPRLWWFALGLWLALTAGMSTALWHARRDAIDGQAREMSLLSLALTDALDRGLHGVEEGLHAMRLELREARLPLGELESARALHTRAELMPLVRTIWLVDGGGRLLAASDATPLPEPASFFPALDRLADDATALSLPFADAAAKGSLVALAVRVADAPGMAGGWILAALGAEDLRGAFSVATPAADARLAVFRSDGTRLAGSVYAEPMPDEAGLAEHLAGTGMGLRRLHDGTERLVSVRELPHFGVKLMLTRDLDAVLAPWREGAWLSAIGLTLLLAIMAVAIHIVQRLERRRALAQRALESELARASKLEALGTLAGGVAHDFNNVLAAIVGFCEMAQDSAAPGSDQERQIAKSLQAALRGKALVDRILAFSRGGAHVSVVFELAPVIEEALALLSASLPPGILLERNLAAHGARLRGDPTQAFESIMNLCTNAIQAMPHGGVVGIQLERRQVTAARVLSHSRLAAGNYLALTVSDQGVGITPEVMEHLFEPFFTTRAAQSGTGLGLAVVHGVVAEFGGAIDVESVPGQGARFTLYFPDCTEDALGLRPLLSEAAPGGAGQSLLVVDDEPALMAMVVETLKGLGYEPVGYSDPVAALEALRDNPQRFAAVVTDEVMPGLSGTQLTEALRVHAPHLPVLLVSGYGGALLASRAAAAGVTRVLAKPLQRAELMRALAEMLH